MREFGRKTKIIVSVVVAILLITIIYISVINKKDNDAHDDSSDYTPVTTLSGIIECSNEFSFEMYHQLQNQSENVFFSPYSITTALGMAYEGARGETANEMARVLRLPSDNQTRWDLIYSFQTALNEQTDAYTLLTANAFWLKENQDLLEAYSTIIESYYMAQGEQLDFEGDPVGSANSINAWVEQETNGKIKELIASSDINPMTYLILTNAIYFKSNWKYQFSPNATSQRIFYLDNGENLSTEMMFMSDEDIDFNYASNADCQLLQLPYTGEEVSMYIMLPWSGTTIDNLEYSLDYDYYMDLKEGMSKKWVSISLPKFKFEQEYNLGEYLKDMGMPTAFTANSANFSGITNPSTNPLYIQKVIQKSYIDVTEEGTEAAAATGVHVMSYGDTPQPITFNANHPFIFFIEHEDTGQILFMGKVENPNA